MEKAKAYIKNELRGGSLNDIPKPVAASTTTTTSTTSSSLSTPSLSTLGTNTNNTFSNTVTTPSCQGQQQRYDHHQQVSNYPENVNNNDKVHQHHHHNPGNIHETASSATPLLCYVCAGQVYSQQPLRATYNADRPTEPYFPFLSQHEPPNGVKPITDSQQYVMACLLCYQSLIEQWQAFERNFKPLQKRIYYLKRTDGKSFVGADITKQSECTSHMLNMNIESLPPSSLPALESDHKFFYARPTLTTRNSSDYENSRSMSRIESPHARSLPTDSCGAGGPSPSPLQQRSRNGLSQAQQSRPCSHESSTLAQLPSPLSRPGSSSGAGGVGGSSETPAVKIPSTFAQHKLKMNQISYVNSIHNQDLAQKPKTSGFPNLNSTQQQQQHQQHYGRSQSAIYDADMEAFLSTSVPVAEESTPMALDLRHSASNSVVETSTESSSSFQRREVITTTQNTSVVDIGILDLSMPDKNSTTEVCYVCGDEHRRGSLLELSTVKPKELKDRNRPYFPIFNEQHPRPARSRPKDPRGMIQTCRHCYDYLILQWNRHQVSGEKQSNRAGGTSLWRSFLIGLTLQRGLTVYTVVSLKRNFQLNK